MFDCMFYFTCDRSFTVFTMQLTKTLTGHFGAGKQVYQ